MSLRKSLLIASFTLALQSVAPCAWADTLTQKQRYSQAMSYQASDIEHTLTQLRALGDEGYARAVDRLAYFTFKGVGVDKDVDAAIALYKSAVAAGRTASLVSLGKVYLTEKRYQEANDTLQMAADEGHDKAIPVLAWAHATRRLGPLSQPSLGYGALIDLAADDNRSGQFYLLDAATRLGLTPTNIDHVLDRLHTRLADGDAKAAESLARYYRMQPHPRGTVSVRASVLETHGIRDKIRIEEGLYLARDQRPGQFWTASQALVQSAPADVYARALTVSARINKNAYVRIIQSDLRALGYQVGRPSPYLNTPLIRAINTFCRDYDITKDCAPGPLKSSTIKAIASKLADLRPTA